jgi:LuxR family maltose regulon positive regulatory protein
MSVPLLATKLYIPPVRPEFLPRPRLIQRLNAGIHSSRKLTLLSAPAGFGKTTLLSEWVNQCQAPVGWVSLEQSDADLTRFLSYAIAALQTLHPDIGRATLAMVQAPQPSTADLLLTTLINEIVGALNVGATTACPFTLILDDYHVIDNPVIHDALGFLLDHLPPPPQGMHIVIASRADPPLPLPRLRARGQMIELRSDDLRFTLEEATAFLNQVMRLGLSANDVAALDARTEGWVAGLHLAALSMQGREDVRGFVRAFAGSHRYILDYLADEVFYRQPEPVQTFLLQTAVLDRLTGGLCNALTGRNDGHTMLEMLERANLFVAPLDDQRRWYRYHPLFAELLRYRLEQAMPDQVPELHRRASEWYAANERVYEAIGHALAANDVQRAARLVEEADPTMVMRGEVATLLSWLDALPDEIVRSRPRLSLSYAWAFFVTTRLDAIEPRIQDVLRVLEVASDYDQHWPEGLSSQVENYLAEIAALRAFDAVYRGTPQRAIALCQQVLTHSAAGSLMVRGAISSVLGDAYRETDQIAAASRSYEQAIALSSAAGHSFLSMVLTDDLARIRVSQGRLRQAAQTFQRVVAWGGGRRLPLYPVAQALVGLGDLAREWNALDEAERYLTDGIQQAEWGGYSRYTLSGYVSMARVRLARGDADGAWAFITQAEQLAEKVGLAAFITQIAAYRTRLWLTPSGGDPVGRALLTLRTAQAGQSLPAAVRWARACGLSIHDQPGYAHEVEYLTLARVRLAEARQSPTTVELAPLFHLLAQLLQAAEQSGRIGSAIEILMLQALAWQIRGDPAKAMIALERALALAEPEGYVRLFVDEGAPMAGLLRQAAARGLFPGYVARLASVYGAQPDTSAARQALTEPLTERELEVLRLMAAGLSNREIARELSVALSTAKAHVRQIFDKLDVHSRTQAVARAREWDLL